MRGNRGFNGVYSGSEVYFIYESDRTKTWKMIAEEQDFSSSSGPHNAAKRFAVAFDLFCKRVAPCDVSFMYNVAFNADDAMI